MKKFRTLSKYDVGCYINRDKPAVLTVGFDIYRLNYEDNSYFVKNITKSEVERGTFIKVGNSFELIIEEPCFYA
jgi:hypothetical protein